MRALKILATQGRYAVLTATRSPRALMFGIVLPIFLLVLFNEIFATGSNRITHVDGKSIDTKAYYTAGLAAYAIMSQTFTSLAVTVTTQRESGQLKRLRGTPMPAWTFIVAWVLRSVVFVVAMVIVVFLIGVLAFGVHLHPAEVLGLAVYVAAGTAALATLGLAATIVCSTAESASAGAPFAAIIISFGSGVFIPLALLPGWLVTVGKVFPLEHLAAGIQHGLVIGATGTGITAADLGILLAWAAFGLLVAAWRFRWEPQTAGV